MRFNKEFYRRYLSSEKWQFKRALVLEGAENRCQWNPHEERPFYQGPLDLCSKTERLQVHHLSYDNLGNEPLEDLQALCDLHHRSAELRGRALCEQCSQCVFVDLGDIPSFIKHLEAEEHQYLTVKDLIEIATSLCDGCFYLWEKEMNS